MKEKTDDEFVFQNHDDFVFQNDEFDSNHEVPNQMENSDIESGHLPKNNSNQEQSSTTEKDMVKKTNKEKKKNRYNSMQILNSFLKDSAPKTKESLKNVSKFSWCDLGRDCIKRKVKVNVEKLTEMEIAKWKKGISTFDAH